MQTIDRAVRIIWDYMLLHQPLKECDAIFLLGSRDPRTAEYAAELFRRGYGKWLIISGGSARLRLENDMSEADYFANIAIGLGVPREKLILED